MSIFIITNLPVSFGARVRYCVIASYRVIVLYVETWSAADECSHSEQLNVRPVGHWFSLVDVVNLYRPTASVAEC